jgi:hypothetical protein
VNYLPTQRPPATGGMQAEDDRKRPNDRSLRIRGEIRQLVLSTSSASGWVWVVFQSHGQI